MKILHLCFAVLCLLLLASPGFAQDEEPSNHIQCHKANGFCYRKRCSKNYETIGRCRTSFCCRRREE
ncbi:---NA--- [Podarcis lilfordi]|uniref:---NA n=1 Tax=Podarcis lilfordi TaxID=74358 RepID=A0AA35K486_9SAUR|nr:---NA--- [Podarcis lilfordi]